MPNRDVTWSLDDPTEPARTGQPPTTIQDPTTIGRGGTQPPPVPSTTRQGGGTQPTVIHKSIIVDANSMWTETGLSLEAGDILTVDATGQVNGNTNKDDLAFKWVGPDGWGEDPTLNWWVAGAPAVWVHVLGRGSSFMCLTGRIGHGAPFKVGSHFQASAGSAGDLLLGINSPISDHMGRTIRNIDDLNRGAWTNQGQLMCTVQIRRKSE